MDANRSGVPVLELRGVGVRGGGAPLLRGVSETVRAGECVVVRGPSGCGKTTLLRAVAGLDAPAEGDVLLDGRPAEVHGWPRFRRTVCLAAQAAAMLPGTVRDNLARAFAYRSAAGAFPADHAAVLLDRLGVGRERLDQAADSLSAGQRQRVSLVRSVLVRPRVLLLDEPTSALDAAAVEHTEEFLRELCAAGVALLVVTHDVTQATRLGDRVLDLEPHATGTAGAA